VHFWSRKLLTSTEAPQFSRRCISIVIGGDTGDRQRFFQTLEDWFCFTYLYNVCCWFIDYFDYFCFYFISSQLSPFTAIFVSFHRTSSWNPLYAVVIMDCTVVFCHFIHVIMCHFQEEDVEMTDEKDTTETHTLVAEAKATTQTSSVKKVGKLFDTILCRWNIVSKMNPSTDGWIQGWPGWTMVPCPKKNIVVDV